MLFIASTGFAQDYEAMRNEMIDQQLKARGINDYQVLNAMQAVERHKYVPDELQQRAYGDHPLPIGHQQTISQPYIVALMTQLLEPSERKKILEIGTGSGYQAAVLGELFGEVYSIEIIQELAERSADILKQEGYNNVHVKHGDGFSGWPEHAPFDGIIVTCSPEDVPEPLKEQLALGGKIIIPVGTRTTQTLVVLTKQPDGFKKESITAVRFVPMVDEKGERH